MNIWLMDHYSNPPQDLGDARQYSNARELSARGHEVHVIACSFNHLSHSHYPYELNKRWAHHRFSGIDFTLIGARAYQSNFEFSRIMNMLDFAMTAWLGKWLKNLRAPDLIVGSCPDPFVGLAAALLASRYQVPFILEIRDPWPYAIVEVTGHGKYHPFVFAVDRIMRYLYKKADRIIMLSKHSSDLLVEGGADANKIVWIPQGVDLRMSPRPRPAPDDGVFAVTYLGAHNTWNSLDTVLDAAKLLQKAGDKEILFRFVGAGASKAALMQRASSEGIANVRFDAPVGKDQVCQVQHESDAFIINNRRDGVSKRWMSFNKLFDYLAAGRPVVFGSYTENDPVRESGAGISVEAGNASALAEAVHFLSRQSPKRLFEYGMAGRRFIEDNYSIPVLIDRFEAMACGLTGLRPGYAVERG
jgi:hypothetical protein